MTAKLCSHISTDIRFPKTKSITVQIEFRKISITVPSHHKLFIFVKDNIVKNNKSGRKHVKPGSFLNPFNKVSPFKATTHAQSTKSYTHTNLKKSSGIQIS